MSDDGTLVATSTFCQPVFSVLEFGTLSSYPHVDSLRVTVFFAKVFLPASSLDILLASGIDGR